ncbi:MAG: WbqC family protein [Cytophagales bacterium]
MTPPPLLIEPHYLPTLACFKKIYQTEALRLAVCHRYQKKTFQNRCYLATTQGLQRLTIPVQHHTTRGSYADVKIDYDMPWPLKHIRAIQTAYGKMPYHGPLADLLFPIYLRKPTFLIDLTLPIIEACCTFLQLDKQVSHTKAHPLQTTVDVVDLRGHFTPQKAVGSEVYSLNSPNLSVLHLLATQGCYAHDYLAAPFSEDALD